MTDIPFHVAAPMLMGNAQHDPAQQVGTPSIVEQRVFWIPNGLAYEWPKFVENIEQFAINLHNTLVDKTDTDNTKSFGIQGADKASGIVRLLKHNYKLNSSGAIEKLPDTEQPQDYTRYETITLHGVLGTLPVIMRIGLHREYWTMKTIIDLSLRPEAGPLHEGVTLYDPTDKEYFEKMQKALNTINDKLTERFAKVATNEVKGDKVKTAELMTGEYQTLFTDLWDKIEERYIAKAYKPLGLEKLGTVAAPFRGFIFSRGLQDANAPTGDVSTLSKALKRLRGNKTVPHEPFINLPWPEKAPSRRLHTIVEGKPFELEDDPRGGKRLKNGVDIVDTLLSLLLAGGIERARDVEHIFSPAQDFRAIYASALGPQKPNAKPEDTTPVHFILYMSHDEHFQIGRLVDWILTLGTTRIAALYDLDGVELANERLQKVEADIAELNRTLQDRLKNKSEDVATDVLKISTELARIASGEKSNPDNNDEKEIPIIGGLQHRVQRSLFYRKEYHDTVPLMRFGRIEGFQPYPQFIEDAVGTTYNLFRMVGERFQEAQTALTEIDEKIQTEESVKTQKITAEGTEKSAGFLWAADIFVCSVAGPYYVIHSLPEAIGKDNLHHWFHDESTFPRIAYSVGLILAAREPIINGFIFAGKTTLEAMIKTPQLDPRTEFLLDMLYDDLVTKNLRPLVDASKQTNAENIPTPK